jgi:imidazolonepropionase-like amidohydrolase
MTWMMAAHHVDIIKIWVDPLHGKVPEMAPTIYAAVIEEAHKNRLRVAAHEYKLDDAKQLVEDGIDVLAHSVRDQAVDAAFVRSMLQHHTWYIPTLALDEAFYIYTTNPDFMQTNFFKQAAGPQLLVKLKGPPSPQAAQSQQDETMGRRNVKTLYDAGVQIAFGTDSGAAPGRIPGFSEHRELEDLVQAGLTPLQALTLATGQTGQLLHTLDPTINVGLISLGFSADLIVLSGDPLKDIRNTRRIVAVYHRGRPVPNPPPSD